MVNEIKKTTTDKANKIAEDKLKRIQDIRDKITKEHGKGSVMELDSDNVIQVPSTSSGSLKLDKILGVGGYPKGRIIEIAGFESSGKSTACLQAVAEVQKNGGIAAFIDAEHSVDPKYSKALGVNLSELIFSQPDTAEQALEIVDDLCDLGEVSLIVVDSVAALVPQAEDDGEMGQSHMALTARLMSQALRKLKGKANRTGTTIIFVNQFRQKIGIMFGRPETTTGGLALRFYASIRLEMRRSETNTIGGSEAHSITTKVKIIKNKVAPPFRETELEIVFGKGFNILAEIVDLALEYDIIQKAGSWYSMGDEKIGQGKANTQAWFEQNTKARTEVEAKIREYIYAK